MVDYVVRKEMDREATRFIRKTHDDHGQTVKRQGCK